jgi:glutamine cyclotransferase
MLKKLLLLGMIGMLSCNEPTNSEMTPPPEDTQEIPVSTFRVINTFPHDPKAFTQGLVFENGVLYEGTGLNGQSTIRRVNLETGVVEQIHQLSPILFGEGIALYNNKIYQLTWKARTGFIYDKDSFQELRSFSYPTEGWGITHDGNRFIMSDGTATLYFRDPITLDEIGRVTVLDNGEAVTNLNELEYVNGEVYANVWLTDQIARINPVNGQVIGWIDLTGLLDPNTVTGAVDVLNGIAYDPDQNRLFVTGKLWPSIFEIELVEEN